jgi:hypothetical protein
MGFLIFLFILTLFMSAFVRATREQKAAHDKAKQDFVVEEVVKNCPPHKWRYLEVRDTEGKTIKWKLICDLCGPLKPSGGPARME